MSDVDCTPGYEPRSVATSFIIIFHINNPRMVTTIFEFELLYLQNCLEQQTSAKWIHKPQPFTALFPGTPGWAVARREPLDFMV